MRFLSSLARIKEPNAHSWNTMIKGYSMTLNPRDSIVFYAKNMGKLCVSPQAHLYFASQSLFKGQSRKPTKCFCSITEVWVRDHFVQNSLVSTFVVCVYIKLLRKVFVEMQKRDVISYTALIDGFKRNRRSAEALELFLEMKKTGVRVDEDAQGMEGLTVVVAQLANVPAGSARLHGLGDLVLAALCDSVLVHDRRHDSSAGATIAAELSLPTVQEVAARWRLLEISTGASTGGPPLLESSRGRSSW
nr:pentatricopeptide repeat-containing protein At1g50270 [Ipomoea batatas]